MAGAFSFASFSRTAGRNGGWGIGELKGDITLDQAHRLRELIPSSINDGVDPGNYPSKEVVAQLTRRFAWLPNGDAGPGFSFYASAQAGEGSTHRPPARTVDPHRLFVGSTSGPPNQVFL